MPANPSLAPRTKVFLILAAIAAGTIALSLGLARLFHAESVEAVQERDIARTLELASSLIRDRYGDLSDKRLDSIMDKRSALRRELGLYLAEVEALHSLELRGTMTRAQAQAAAVETARLASIKAGVNIFAFDEGFAGVVHSDLSLAGMSWKGLKGVTGSGALEKAAQVVARDGSDTLLLWWPGGDSGVESKHLARLAFFAPWGWHVGASLDYGRLEARAVQDRNQTVRDIVDSLARIRMGETGRLFIMDAQSLAFLLPPPGGVPPEFAASLEQASRQAQHPLARVPWGGPGAGGMAFAVSIPETGWHVGMTMESRELGQASMNLAWREGLAFALALALALALAWAAAGRITRPLSRLAGLAAGIDPARGASPETIAGLRRAAQEERGEAGALARAGADILESLGTTVRELENASQGRERSSRELDDSKRELERLNAELESRVRLRTAALEAANQRLKNSEARYRGLFTDSPVPFLELDFSALAAFMRSPEVLPVCDLEALFRNNPDFAADCAKLVGVLDANPAAMEFAGAASKALLVEKMDSVRIPEAFALFSGMDKALSEGAASYTCELAVPSPGREPRHCVVTLRPLPGHERSLDRVVAALQDITDIRRGEERLRAAHEEARAASRAKSEFLANMSHEIRTPISAILGLSELSRRQTDPAKTHVHLSMISEAAQSLLDVVADVLALSRMESGRLVLDAKPFELSDALEKPLAAARAQCRQKGLDFEQDIPGDLPGPLLGDPARLGQLVSKLLDNAVKFTPAGSVRFTVAASPSGAGVTLLLRVRDTGEGVPPDQAGAIFESFRQADSSFSKKYQGAGLGLTISRELAALMGGRIWVESEPGFGSEFCFEADFALAGQARNLPPEPAPEPAREAAREAAPRTGAGERAEAGEEPTARAPESSQLEGNGQPVNSPAGREAPREKARRLLRVLVAEDNPVNRHVFTEFLTSLGHEVATASDGHEALEAVGAGGVDFVFMDVQMPRLDGVEAVRRIRDGSCGSLAADLPVVALTAYALDGDRERFLEAGMTGYLSKPVTLDALKEALRAFDPDTAPERDVEGGPREELEPLMAEFAAYIRMRADEAGDFLAAGNLAEAAKAGHDVKGSSMAFGVLPVNKAGARLEAASREGDARAAGEALKAVYTALSELENAAPASPLSMA